MNITLEMTEAGRKECEKQIAMSGKIFSVTGIYTAMEQHKINHLKKMQEALAKIAMASSSDQMYDIVCNATKYLMDEAGVEENTPEEWAKWFGEVRNCKGDFL